jgi:hypothetical protein
MWIGEIFFTRPLRRICSPGCFSSATASVNRAPYFDGAAGVLAVADLAYAALLWRRLKDKNVAGT